MTEPTLKEEVLEATRNKRKKKRKIHPNSLEALKTRKPFQPNNPSTGFKDERINRKGSPSTTAAMRALIQSIGADLLHVSEERDGKKRTKMISRIAKKITEMYESSNPADSVAILKGGWPGLLGEEKGDGKPKELVLKIVYENRRVTPGDDFEEGDVIDEGGPGPGVGGGAPKIVGAPHGACWGLQLEHTENETTPQDTQADIETFFCVLCNGFRPLPGSISKEAGGWVCQIHQK